MTDTDETALTEADERVARLNQDLALAETDRLREQIGAGIRAVRDRLVEAGFVTYKHYELRHPSSSVTFGSSYAGGEYAVTLTGLPNMKQPVTLRLTTALQARDPMAIDRLGAIVTAISAGAEWAVWVGAGNVVYGIEATVLATDNLDDGEMSLLFGERYTEDEDEDDPAEFDEGDDEHEDGFNNAHLDDGPLDWEPPDMSGPGNPSGEGR